MENPLQMDVLIQKNIYIGGMFDCRVWLPDGIS